MIIRKQCSAWLGLAGACLFVIGCGGGDVPDPGSDAKAADGNVPGGGGGGRQQGAAPAVAAADAAKPGEAAPAQGQGGDAAKDQSKGQGGDSTTSDMLALSGGPSTPPAGGGSEAPPPANPGPGAPGSGPPGPGGGRPNMGPNAPGAGGGGSPGGMVPGSGPPGPGGGRPNMGPNAPGAGGNNTNPGNMMAQQMKMQTQRGAGGGGPGGAAGGASDATKAVTVDVSSPVGAVRTFLEALKARDADSLAESTARRAAVDSSAKNQDIFGKILDISLSDTALDELAKKFEGYQVAGENPPKSTGKVDVVIQKSSGNGGRTTRKVTVRREKKGWGVLDIGPSTEFTPLGGGSRRSGKSR